jgi:hypothetical protein
MHDRKEQIAARTLAEKEEFATAVCIFRTQKRQKDAGEEDSQCCSEEKQQKLRVSAEEESQAVL